MPSSLAVRSFSPGLGLVHMGLWEINAEGAPGTGPMAASVHYPVPHHTKAVHVAVIKAQVKFDSCRDAKPLPFAGLTYEITDPDDSELSKGSFKFNFNAWLESQDPKAKWCGYFLLEIICFG